MNKARRILALIGVVLLLGLYGTTLILSFIDSPWANKLLTASLYLTVIIPVLLYVFSFIYKLLKDSHKSNTPSETTDGKESWLKQFNNDKILIDITFGGYSWTRKEEAKDYLLIFI